MLIDFHTHCFPDKIAVKAIEKLSDASGGLKPYTDGTLSGLEKSMQQGNVDISVVLSIATNAHQQKSVNDFAALMNEKENIVAFGSVYPFAEDALYELDRIKELGLKGIKLHPDYQGFDVDDPMMRPIYRKISEHGFILTFHAGHDYGFAPPYGATPEKLLKALSWIETPVIAAHWGGVGCYEAVLDLLCGREIYFDTSFGYSHLPKYFAQKIIEKHGTEKLLFGTDTPWHRPEMEMRLINSLRLSEQERELIFYKNAVKLLQL